MLKEIQEVTYGAGHNKQTGNVVTGFNTMRFTKFCDKVTNYLLFMKCSIVITKSL